MFRRTLLFFLAVCLSFTLSAQNQYAKPKPGEGIGAFLERNGRPSKIYYQEFIRLNKKKLSSKGELLKDVRYQIPPLRSQSVTTPSTDSATLKDAVDSVSGQAGPSQIVETSSSINTKEDSKDSRSGKSFNEPLFGTKYARGKVDGNSLKGACFYIVSGHGGPDPGAIGRIGKTELHEDEYAYDVALRLARVLMQEGAEVRIIIQDKKDGIRDDLYLSNSKRETCMGDEIPLNQLSRLKQRCEKVNTLYNKDKKKFTYCRAIFLHVDSRSKGTETDVFFYYADGNARGRKLAKAMQGTFQSMYDKHQPNRGFEGTVGSRNLFVLRNTNPVSVFVELGNIQNPHDQKRFILSSNRQALANWMLRGFITDYKKNK